MGVEDLARLYNVQHLSPPHFTFLAHLYFMTLFVIKEIENNNSQQANCVCSKSMFSNCFELTISRSQKGPVKQNIPFSTVRLGIFELCNKE